MERLKDILYDLSDILITVGIIAIIFFVVTWKLNDVLPTSETLLNSPKPSEATETISTTQNETEKTTEQQAGTPRDQVETITSISPQTSSIDENIESETTLSNNLGNSSTQFIIPYGATLNSIAKDLKKSNLIDNEDNFIQKVIDRDDAGKILAGTFELSSTMSNDDILDILIGD